jgi:hypothetical protein
MRESDVRDLELEERSEYLQRTGWKWTFPMREKSRIRKLFTNENDQLLRPKLTVYRS